MTLKQHVRLDPDHAAALRDPGLWRGCGDAYLAPSRSARVREILAAYERRPWRLGADDRAWVGDDPVRVELVLDADADRTLAALAKRCGSLRAGLRAVLAGWLARRAR